MPYTRPVMVRPTTLTADKVREALIACDGNVTRASKLLNVSRTTVHAWMREHDIRVERRVTPATS